MRVEFPEARRAVIKGEAANNIDVVTEPHLSGG